MGADGKKKDDSELAESSGLTDILEVASSIGADEDTDTDLGLTPASEIEDDDHHNLAAGFGGVAVASLVAGDDSVPPPAAPAISPSGAAPAPSPAATKTKTKAPPTPSPVAASHGPASAAAVTLATPTSPPREGGGGTTWMILAGVAVLAGLIWFATQNRSEGAETTAEATPAVATPEAPEPEPQPEPEPAVAAPAPEPEPAANETEGAAEEDDDAVVIDDAQAQSTDGASEEAVVASARKGRSRKSDSKSDSEPDAAKPEPEPEPEPEPAPEPVPKAAPPPPAPDDDGKFATECLLNPDKPGCAEILKKRGPGISMGSLPDKLSQTQIRQGITPLKGKAKACGTQHNITEGTVVRIKLSIEGATGKVISAEPMSPHDKEPVGKCVAEILKDATFPQFQSQQQGTTYPVTM